MNDEWISLADAFKLVLAVEQDEVLVEKLLVPLLWKGKLPAISRRAFIDDELMNDCPVITYQEWAWAESPVLFDWLKSRGSHPAGSSRLERNSENYRIASAEYFRIEVPKKILVELFPNIDKKLNSTKEISFNTWLVGRPSARRIISQEIERRAAAGERYKSAAAWAEVLEDWFQHAYGPSAPGATSKTIINAFRGRLKSLLIPRDAVSRPKSRPK